jgi:hypothetical protein
MKQPKQARKGTAKKAPVRGGTARTTQTRKEGRTASARRAETDSPSRSPRGKASADKPRSKAVRAPARKTAARGADQAAASKAPTASSAAPPAAPAQGRSSRREPGLSGFAAAHAGPLGLLGMGAALLAVEIGRRRGGAAQAASLSLAQVVRERLVAGSNEVRERLTAGSTEARTQLADGASQLGEQAVELSQRGYEQLGAAGRRALALGQRHPLASGLLVLAAGAAAAAWLPSTRRENKWMGGARDGLVQRAQRSADDLKGRLREGAEDLRETLAQLTDAAQ